jgi:hypothetical protein
MGADFSKFQGVLRIALQISPSRQSQRIQNAANNKDLSPKTQGMNGVELHCVHSPLRLLNLKSLFTENKVDHVLVQSCLLGCTAV